MHIPEISVIVPVYNVKDLLPRCMESILSQSFTDMEIILVDDGSRDGGGEVCDRYQAADPRVQVIHQENQGLSAARNAGLALAKGKYISFIDSDDYIHPEMLSHCYGVAEKEEADCVLCGRFDCYADEEPKVNEKEQYCVLTSVQAIHMVLDSRETSVTVWDKLYRRSLFENDLRFRVGKTAEDAFIIVDVLARAKKVVYTSRQLYYYVHRKGSISTARFNPKLDFGVVEAYDYNYRRVCEIDKEALEAVARMRCCWARFSALDKMIAAGADTPENRGELVAFLRENGRFIRKNPIFTRARKLASALLSVSYPLYRAVALAQYKRNQERLH